MTNKSIQMFTPKFEIEECLKELRICLEKGWTGMGFKTLEFEEAWKNFTSLPNAHFLASNTAGLHMAIEVFKEKSHWNSQAEIITTPLTFISTNHVILYAGLKAVFADVDDYLCLDPISVESKITKNTKAIMFVGMGGNCGQYEKILELCIKYNLKLILDAAHMAGTRYKGVHIGHEADVTIFSFQAVKNLPTADSGMICFKDKENDDLARKLSWLGINKDTFARTSAKGNYKWDYDVENIGFKYHGNSIMASLGLVQLKYLDRDNAYRRQIARWYRELLKKVEEITFIETVNYCESAQHLIQILVPERNELLEFLYENNIFPGVHYKDNTQYKMFNYAKGMCDNAAKYSDQLLSLPIHLNLTYEDIIKVATTLKKFFKK